MPLDYGSIVLARKLGAKLEEALAGRTKRLLDGMPPDYATYREQVGYARALREFQQWIQELSNLEEEPKRNAG